MTIPAHLTDEEFGRYRDRGYSASELLDADRHIGACAACRDRLYAEGRAFAGLRGLRAELAVHLEYADIVACSEGRGNAQQLAHIRNCATCQAEVQDLSRFRTELSDAPRKPIGSSAAKSWAKYRIAVGIAAAAVVIGGGATFVLSRPKPAPAPATASVPPQRVDPLLPPAERHILGAAVASGRLERPAVLDSLISKPAALLSSPQKETFTLLGPVGTTVLTDRPMLRWTMMPSATSYVVSIVDEQLQKVMESPALSTTEWHPPAPLPRGKVLTWHVTASTPAGAVRQPAPPAQEARFQIVDPQVVEQIEKIRRDFPGNPLLLAALYAHHGALDDAETMLRAMDAMAAQSFREALEKVRKGE